MRRPLAGGNDLVIDLTPGDGLRTDFGQRRVVRTRLVILETRFSGYTTTLTSSRRRLLGGSQSLMELLPAQRRLDLQANVIGQFRIRRHVLPCNRPAPPLRLPESRPPGALPIESGQDRIGETA